MLYSTSLAQVKKKMQTGLNFFLGASFEGAGKSPCRRRLASRKQETTLEGSKYPWDIEEFAALSPNFQYPQLFFFEAPKTS